jgi:uncharacterized protein (TIGR03435 family)
MIRAFIITATAAAALSQTPAFEVASIRLHEGAVRQVGRVPSPGPDVRYVATTVRDLIRFAYDLRDYQLEGASGWIGSDTDRYDITALAAGDQQPSPEQGRAMLQNLLKDRFQFRFHRETKEMPAYMLAVGKATPKLTRSDSINSNISVNGSGQETQLNFRGAPMDFLAQQLANLPGVGRPVLDRTGLTGKFDFQLKLAAFQVRMTADPGASPVTGPSGESLFTALEEQLGLKLESQKAPFEILVIDSAARPTEN